jgi:hypothetical protein
MLGAGAKGGNSAVPAMLQLTIVSRIPCVGLVLSDCSVLTRVVIVLQLGLVDVKISVGVGDGPQFIMVSHIPGVVDCSALIQLVKVLQIVGLLIEVDVNVGEEIGIEVEMELETEMEVGIKALVEMGVGGVEELPQLIMVSHIPGVEDCSALIQVVMILQIVDVGV